MADIKAKVALKTRLVDFLLICLLLISLVSIYEQDKLLQIHHLHLHPSNNGGHEILGPVVGGGSAQILMKAAREKRPILDEEIDHHLERARCARYKLGYAPKLSRRRIFWGAAIADDSWHVIAAQGIETYGIFHTVAFVESNRTISSKARPFRFGKSSTSRKILTETGIFGPDALVSVDYYVNENAEEETPTLVGLEREHAQRSLILERWKKNGMTKNDIGYLSDTDETFTRDFLRAMQICDVPQFASDGKDGHNKCAAPKVYGLVAIFEGSPECVSSEAIYHPALMMGECIQGIGDATVHPTPIRFKDVATNWRHQNYTHNTYYSALHDQENPTPAKSLPSNVNFPLWNAADYRRHPGGFFYGDDDLPLYVGYHIHNFFDDISVMRKKYLTYGHEIQDALTKPLGEMNREVNLMVRCSKHNNTFELEGSVMKKYKSNEERRKNPIAARKGGLGFLRQANYGTDTGGAIPLAFRSEAYVTARHNQLVAMVEKDERERMRAISISKLPHKSH